MLNKFILNHSDHVQVVRCISALKGRRENCLQLLDDGREGEIMPEGYLPFDYNLWRIMGHDIDLLPMTYMLLGTGYWALVHSLC